jgi:hypothetical protein
MNAKLARTAKPCGPGIPMLASSSQARLLASEPLPEIGRVYDDFDWIAPLEAFVAKHTKARCRWSASASAIFDRAGAGRHGAQIQERLGPRTARLRTSPLIMADRGHASRSPARTRIRSSRRRRAPGPSCTRISRRMPGCCMPAAPRSRFNHTRNSPSALRWPAARLCAARAMRPIASWHLRRPRLPSRWRAPGSAARSRAFSPARAGKPKRPYSANSAGVEGPASGRSSMRMMHSAAQASSAVAAPNT